MKDIVIKRFIKGLLYGSAMFVCALLFVNVCLDNNLAVLPYQYTRLAVGALIIGIGFSVSSLIYDEDRIPFLGISVLQLIICILVLLLGVIASGGVPNGSGFGLSIIFFLIEIGFGAIIWFISFMYFWREAKLIQKRIKELEDANPAIGLLTDELGGEDTSI